MIHPPAPTRQSAPLAAAAVGLLGSLLAVLGGCSSTRTLMPAPVLYAGTDTSLAGITVPERAGGPAEILYATDRQYGPDLGADPYPPERERFLRLGRASVLVGADTDEWSDVLARSVQSKRSTDLTLELGVVEDFGPLAESTIPFDPIHADPDVGKAGERFATLVNDRLADASRKEIVVYVSPFKVPFDEAVLATAEFQHFTGREGVFVTYSWPSKEGNLNYFNAAENAYRTRRCLRVFIEYLLESTDAERIHLMSYSAGARVLSGALHQLILVSRDMSPEERERRMRLGNIIFCSPDIDAGAFLEHMVDGLGWMPGKVTIYTSTEDGALKLSRFLYGNPRLGMLDSDDFLPQAVDLLRTSDQFSIVSVTDAEDATTGNGHGYFRLSPWVSSDIILTLARGESPGNRGLVRAEDDAVWRFPEDYVERIGRITAGWGEGRPR